VIQWLRGGRHGGGPSEGHSLPGASLVKEEGGAEWLDQDRSGAERMARSHGAEEERTCMSGGGCRKAFLDFQLSRDLPSPRSRTTARKIKKGN
jgi:hypothetical protein